MNNKQSWLSPRVRTLVGFLSLPLALTLFALYVFRDRDPQPPIYDVQMHYNGEAWRYFQPNAIVGTMKELNVAQAAVSSTPNEGTFRLRENRGDRIVPLLSPYRRPEDRDNWVNDATLIGYLRDELSQHSYRGIGELHLFPGQLTMPIVQQVFALAVERRLVINLHAEAPMVEELFKAYPDVRVLWAHAGMMATPQTVGNLLDRFRHLYAELSHRTDVAPDGKLSPEWRDLFLRHPDRFMVGSGTYNNQHWYQFRYMIGFYRRWLAELPPDIAERIAYENATRLFTAR